MPITAKELAERLPVEQRLPVVQPPRTDILLNIGTLTTSFQGHGRPLPSRVVAWAWAGQKKWLLPHQWPWGQFSKEEEQQIAQDKKTAVAEKIKAANFDLRGRVEKLPEPQERFLENRLHTEMTPRPFLPPGVTIQRPGAKE